jgi:hypothetical protein
MLVPLGAWRDWEEQFLFVEFDERGIVSKTSFASDYHLMRALVEWLNRNPQSPLDLSQPIEFASSQIDLYSRRRAARFPGTVQLRRDAVLLQPKEGPESMVELRPGQIRKLNVNSASDVSLLVAGLPTRYSHLVIALGISERITFLRYLQQVQPAAIPSLKQKGGSPEP